MARNPPGHDFWVRLLEPERKLVEQYQPVVILRLCHEGTPRGFPYDCLAGCRAGCPGELEHGRVTTGTRPTPRAGCAT